MTSRRLWLVVVVFVSLVGAVFTANVAAGNTPSLGLDLQGGASVTLTPIGEYEQGALDAAVDVIRRRVDSIGVAEPEIIRQGGTVVVNLPGVKNQDEALALIGRTGAVEMRPVIQVVEPTGEETDAGTDGGDAADEGAVDEGGSTDDGSSGQDDLDQTPTTLAEPGAGAGQSRSRPMTPDPDGATDEATGDEQEVVATDGTDPIDDGSNNGLLPGQVVLPGAKDGLLYLLGPAEATGEVFSSDAAAEIDRGAWVVTANLRDGLAGEALWNALASKCFSGGPDCPTRQIAIVLDGEVISAPVVEVANFSGSVQISGNFTESEASDLSKILQFGAVPVDFDVPTVQQVSATLGKDSLNSALIAGLVGVLAVVLFMFAYYRLLAVVALGGVAVAGMLLWSVIAWLSRTEGLAFTLSGAAGVIVSIGTGVDSYIMLFERLKEDIRAGRTLRNSALRGFNNSWRTIVLANASTLIGAGILWWLSIGSVRGFAFFLGLSSLTSMVTVYFFTRPAILLLSRWSRPNERGVLGIRRAASNTKVVS